jgi:ParB family transcriptional regulator, chromosome partitioning protein
MPKGKAHAKKRGKCAYCRKMFSFERATAQFCKDACRWNAKYHRDKELARHDWRTPADIIDAAREVMGGIDLDPASCAKANEIVDATAFYTVREDGLRQPWNAPRVFLNPPYGPHLARWIPKLLAEHARGALTEAVVLVPARVDTRWFAMLDGWPRCHVRGRLRFNGAGTAPFPSIVVYLGPNVDRFAEVFGSWGRVWR